MAKRKAGTKKAKQATDGENGGVVALTKELFQAAITLRGSVEPADYKRYVLPIIFLRFLSLRYERRRAELEALIADKKSDYFGDKKAHPTIPTSIVASARSSFRKRRGGRTCARRRRPTTSRCSSTTCSSRSRTKYPDKLKGLLPRIYAGSNLDAESVRGLINLFSKDIFEADHGGDDLIGRVYEYFIGEFASSEGKRGGEYFTPVSIVKTLVAMLEPEQGRRLRPVLRLGRHVRAVGPLHEAQPPALVLRPGEQGLHLPPVPDEPVHPRPRRQHPAGQLVLRRPARRRSRPTTSWRIRRSTTAARARTAGAPTGSPTRTRA